MSSRKFVEGWKKPRGARLFHSFTAKPIKSLCGQYGREASDDRGRPQPTEVSECCKKCFRRAG